MKIIKALLLASLVAVGLPAVLNAEDNWSPPVNLFDRSTLAGWEYGPNDPIGWTMKDGVLHADNPESPLVSGWTFGDFKLEFNCTLEKDAGLQIILLGDDAQSFSPSFKLVDETTDPKVLAPNKRPFLGKVINVSPNSDHVVRVHREATSISLIVDDREKISLPTALVIEEENRKPSETFRLTAQRRVGLHFNALGAAKVKLWNLRVREPIGKPIFNGRDLAGWWTPGNLASWPVIDGNLVCINQKGDYLRTEKEYSNFILSFDYKMAKRGNSGVGIRTPRDGWPSAEGMELQIQDDPLDTPLERHLMMSIYGRIEPLARADRSEEWNQVVIKAEGRMISAWVNGVLAQQYDTASNPDLKHRPLKGWIGLQDHGARTEFRDVRILELPDGMGLEAWRQWLPRASEVVVDRLMNLDSLAWTSAVVSHARHVRIDGKQEQVVLDVTGPGAVVGINRTGEQGTLAFYFDGEQQPGLTCAAKDLLAHLPLLGPDRQPITTYLPFKSGLKVTLRDGAGADYRFDYVAPPNVSSFDIYQGPDKTLPRGLVSTVTRRYEEFSHGGFREHDGLEHITADSKTIERGQSVPLVELKGSGIVEWWKLKASNKVLSEDNLWLQVMVDGETKPAVEAPARFFFPGLPNQRNYPNFVALQRNGFVSFLAMPYRLGLKIIGLNRGKKAIKDIGITLSTQAVDDVAKLPPLRLRGEFATASQPEIINQTGRGRWVGLVYVLGQEPLPEVAGMIVDGQPRDGWAAASLADILGVSNATGNVRDCHALCGRAERLAWRWLLLAPVDFHESLVLKAAGAQKLNDRLALFYLEK